MFYSASAFNQNIGGWNTASASDMSNVMLYAIACGHAGLSPSADLGATYHPVLAAAACLRSAGMLRRISLRFGGCGVMLLVGRADVLLGVGLQPEHRRLEHRERFGRV
jgi:surface protein